MHITRQRPSLHAPFPRTFNAAGSPPRRHANRPLSLIKESKNVNADDGTGSTALMRAAAQDNAGVIKVLVDAGMDIDARDERGWTALMHAADGGCANALKALVAAGVKVNLRNRAGLTAALLATQGGHTDALRILLDAGANPYARMNVLFGHNAWTLAAAGGYRGILQLLASRGIGASRFSVGRLVRYCVQRL